MRVHINVLYGIVVVLLTLNIISFVLLSSRTAEVVSNQEKLENDLTDYIDQVRQESQGSVNEIVDIIGKQNDLIAQQKNDFDLEIDKLKSSTSGDLSGVVEDVIREVVSIRTDKSTGSGFIIDRDGYIVTNYHVIEGGNFVRVQTFDGSVFEVEIVGVDSFTDIALLKGPSFSNALDFGDSDDVNIGQKVIAIGNPLGLQFTVTEGIVSAVNRLGPNGLEEYIQTDVNLNPGNSGGPLFDKNGEVIGVNNFKLAGAEGLGFALQSDVVVEVVNEIGIAAEHGEIL